tara:strand:+ start:4161 stop:4313 length:153 start_codon:yes stop_codon:yes gene_type:complete
MLIIIKKKLSLHYLYGVPSQAEIIPIEPAKVILGREGSFHNYPPATPCQW